MADEREGGSGPSFLKNVLAGIIVLVVGGLLLAYLNGWLFNEGGGSNPPEGGAEGSVDPLRRSSAPGNYQSRIEISSVRMNRAFEDYDADISGLIEFLGLGVIAQWMENVNRKLRMVLVDERVVETHLQTLAVKSLHKWVKQILPIRRIRHFVIGKC